jgi:hypothetical protein
VLGWLNMDFTLFVLMGQRRQSYTGEYLPEALEVCDGGTIEENPEWIKTKLEYHKNRKMMGHLEFESVAIVQVQVSQKDILKILYPNNIIEGKIK